jgi:hypothetical protein
MQKGMLRWGSVLMVALGLWVLMGWLSSAEAVITIRSAEVINGAAVVKGGNAARAAGISWEGALVTQANNGGNFAFQGVVPADCVGRVEDGVPADAVDVALANCAPVSEAPAPVEQTGQTVPFGPRDDGTLQAGRSMAHTTLYRSRRWHRVGQPDWDDLAEAGQLFWSAAVGECLAGGQHLGEPQLWTDG